MTRIAFTADLHCDDYGSKVDPATGLNARWVDTVAMAEWVAQDANDRGADVLVVGGDFTEARHPAPWRVAQIKAALSTYGGPAVYVRGNHDGIRDGRWIGDVLADPATDSSFASSPGVHLVGETAICAIPYLDRHHLRAMPGVETASEADVSAALGEAFLTIARGMFAAVTAPAKVLVVHQALAGGLMSDSQAAFLGDQGLVVDTRALAAIGFDAILAGHFHKHQVLSTDPLVAYAGAPYRTDFGEEHQEKGYLIVDVEPGKATMEFVSTPARRFVTLTNSDLESDGPIDVRDAVVRVVDVDPGYDVAAIRRGLEADGAFEVTELRRRALEREAMTTSLAEDLTPQQALEAYFAGDDDAEALVELGNRILVEAAS